MANVAYVCDVEGEGYLHYSKVGCRAGAQSRCECLAALPRKMHGPKLFLKARCRVQAQSAENTLVQATPADGACHDYVYLPVSHPADPDPLAACATGPLLQGQPAKCPVCLSKTNSDGLFTGICGKCRCDTVAF